MVSKKALKRAERDRKDGNAAWAPCAPCDAFGTINGHICQACNGIGFVPRNAPPSAAHGGDSK